MPRRCTVCSHRDQGEIDRAILAGEPYRHIASRYGTSTGALQRHKADHLPAALTQAHEARKVASADRLLTDLDALREDAADVYRRAKAAESYTAAVAAIREQGRIIEVLLRVAGELADVGATVNIHTDAAWVQIRTTILRALTPYPEAKSRVVEALDELN